MSTSVSAGSDPTAMDYKKYRRVGVLWKISINSCLFVQFPHPYCVRIFSAVFGKQLKRDPIVNGTDTTMKIVGYDAYRNGTTISFEPHFLWSSRSLFSEKNAMKSIENFLIIDDTPCVAFVVFYKHNGR